MIIKRSWFLKKLKLDKIRIFFQNGKVSESEADKDNFKKCLTRDQQKHDPMPFVRKTDTKRESNGRLKIFTRSLGSRTDQGARVSSSNSVVCCEMSKVRGSALESAKSEFRLFWRQSNLFPSGLVLFVTEHVALNGRAAVVRMTPAKFYAVGCGILKFKNRCSRWHNNDQSISYGVIAEEIAS